MITGYGLRQCFNIRRAYYAKGLNGIEDKRKNNHKPLLTKTQRGEVIAALTTKTPKDFNYEADYWTTGLLGYHIEKTYNVKYKSADFLPFNF